jgi:cation transport ATPase
MNTRISPTRANRQAALNILGAAVVYVASRSFCSHLLATTPPGTLQITLAVLPALPVMWMLWSVHRYLARTDELHRRVHMEALAVAAGGTATFSIVYGLLEESAGFPHLTARWAILLLGLIWVGSGFVLWRRYK